MRREPRLRPALKRRRGGKIQPRRSWMIPVAECEVCGEPLRGGVWSKQGVLLCRRHSVPHFNYRRPPKKFFYSDAPAGTFVGSLGPLGNKTDGTKAEKEKRDRIIDAKNGRRKRKPSRPRKRSRDRAYVR